jgi:NAD(P)-dependent dehydrogenase (short-subunit alcohol dehydrogenase family)
VPEQVRLTFENNVYPYFRITRHALAHMGRGSVIFNTGSVTSFRGSRHLIGLRLDQGRDRNAHLLAGQQPRRTRHTRNGVAPGPIWTH